MAASFKSEAERKEAAKLLDEEEPGPDKTGIGGSTPKVKKKPKSIKKIRESWRTPKGGYQFSPASGVSSETPSSSTKPPVASLETQKEKKETKQR